MNRINIALWRFVDNLLVTCMGVSPEEIERENQRRKYTRKRRPIRHRLTGNYKANESRYHSTF